MGQESNGFFQTESISRSPEYQIFKPTKIKPKKFKNKKYHFFFYIEVGNPSNRSNKKQKTSRSVVHFWGLTVLNVDLVIHRALGCIPNQAATLAASSYSRPSDAPTIGYP